MFCPARYLYSWLYGDSLRNLVRYGYLKVVVGQLCVSESVYLFRNWFPNAGTSVSILMPHLRTRSCVFVQSLRNKHNEMMCVCQLSFLHTTAANIGDTTSNNNQHIKRRLPTTDEQRGIELVSFPIDAKRPFPAKTCCSVCASDEYTEWSTSWLFDEGRYSRVKLICSSPTNHRFVVPKFSTCLLSIVWRQLQTATGSMSTGVKMDNRIGHSENHSLPAVLTFCN